jgi:hypothetical protein
MYQKSLSIYCSILSNEKLKKALLSYTFLVVFQKVLARVVVSADGIYLIGQRLIMVAPSHGEKLVTGIDGQGDDARGAFMDPLLVVGLDTPSLYAQEGSPAVKASF